MTQDVVEELHSLLVRHGLGDSLMSQEEADVLTDAIAEIERLRAQLYDPSDEALWFKKYKELQAQIVAKDP